MKHCPPPPPPPPTPLGKSHIKPLDVLWHEKLCSRKDEDVMSSYAKIFQVPMLKDFKHFILWVDNCSGHNKCWTLLTMLANIVNTAGGPDKVTMKYLVAGHTFMSADSFHHKVETKMNSMGKVYDFNDFITCIKRCGEAVLMEIEDFRLWKNDLSQGIDSKSSRPLLAHVAVAEFMRGYTNLFFKTNHHDKDFKESEFLLWKFLKLFKMDALQFLRTSHRGIPSSKKVKLLII